MNRTTTQNKQLHALLGKLHIDKEMKEELVMQYTNKRTTSSSLMHMEECQRLINYLNASLRQPNALRQAQGSGYVAPARDGSTGLEEACNKMRRKILSICHELQWETPEGKVDYKRLNSYLMKYGYLHKSLNSYTYKELPTLVTQFENILRDAVRKF